MSVEVVRCPYCVMGSEFRPMFRRSTAFVCTSCGHTVSPHAPYSRCACPKCQQMNRLASRCKTSEDLRNFPAADFPRL